MSGTYPVVMGDRGRLVVPAALRDRLHLGPGAVLLMHDTPGGLVLTTREQTKQMLRRSLAGLDLVGELLAERRSDAEGDDAEGDDAEGDDRA